MKFIYLRHLMIIRLSYDYINSQLENNTKVKKFYYF